MTKRIQLFLLAVLVLLSYGCVTYKRFYVKAPDVYKSKSISQTPQKYDFYVHDLSGKNYQAYYGRIEDTSFISVLSEVDAVSYPEVLWNNELKQMQNDIHLFVNDTLKPDQNVLPLHQSDVTYAVVYSTSRKGVERDAGAGGKNGQSSNSTFLVVFLAIVGIFVLIGLLISMTINSAIDSAVGACYIATMAYGSYEAPEVIVLRKFRDQVLMQSKGGRFFIKSYYATSPYFVRVFKNVGWVNSLIRNVLDRFVNRLKKQYGW